MSEESPGEFDVAVLEVTAAGKVPVRFVPKSLFVLGSRGQVDAVSRFGSRMLVWVDGDGPPPTPYEEHEMVIGRPIYPGVPRGWAWADPRLNRLVHLTEDTLWSHVLARLVR